MKFLKALISWKLWLNVLLGIGLVVLGWFLIFGWLNTYTNHGRQVAVPDLSTMSVQQAMNTLQDLNLKYEIDSVKFTEDFPPFAILDYYPAAGSMVKPGRRIFIKSNPSTWRPVELPDLIDKSDRIAYTQLAMRGFFVRDTLYEEDPAKGAVLRVLFDGKEIAAGTLLPKGSYVDLVLGRGLGFDMPVPNLIDMNLTEARHTIIKQFFEMGPIQWLGDTRDTIAAKVVYQDPASTDSYDEGQPISIWLSTKTPRELSREINDLDIFFRRKMSPEDSLYYKTLERSRNIDIRDLPEEIRRTIQDDRSDPAAMNQRRPQQAPAQQQAPRPSRPAQIDTTGISIE
ncbi:MAG: PASTA domain-containing protein [Weeksellaceae bacterium]|nr:PASTA domain-containing protein [Weeksellaceae bacterium]